MFHARSGKSFGKPSGKIEKAFPIDPRSISIDRLFAHQNAKPDTGCPARGNAVDFSIATAIGACPFVLKIDLGIISAGRKQGIENFFGKLPRQFHVFPKPFRGREKTAENIGNQFFFLAFFNFGNFMKF